MTTKFKMNCGCALGNTEFKVSTKYLHILSSTKRESYKVQLTSKLISQLAKIKAETRETDGDRTYKVLQLAEQIKQEW